MRVSLYKLHILLISPYFYTFHEIYRVFIKMLWFFWTLPVLPQCWCSTCLECVHTDTEGKQRKARIRNILKSSEKTQYLMNTLYLQKYILYLLYRSGIVEARRWTRQYAKLKVHKVKKIERDADNVTGMVNVKRVLFWVFQTQVPSIQTS